MIRRKELILRFSQRQRKLCLWGLTVLLSLLALVIPVTAVAQEPQVWSEPLLLFPAEQSKLSSTVVSDSSGVVHVFIAADSLSGEIGTIYYRYLKDQTWSDLVDILVAPDGGATAGTPKAVIDRQGWVHLVWVGEGGVYYSKAPVLQAASPRAWTTWKLSEAQAVTPDIALDDQGDLHVVYADIYVSPYVRYTCSSDGGKSWSPLVAVSKPANNAYALDTRLVVDEQDVLHVVWSESTQAFPPSRIYYAQSTDHGQTWTTPLELAAGNYGQASIGIDGDGKIHVFWTGTADWVGKYHTWSPDRGRSWMPVEKLWPGTGGLVGFADMAVDSAGRLHLVVAANSFSGFFAVSTPGETLHTIWLEDHWSPPDHLSGPIMDSKHENTSPKISIAGGNVVHVVWNRFGSEGGDVWYSFAQLTSPSLPLFPVPTPVVDKPTPVVDKPIVQPTVMTEVATRVPLSSPVSPLNGSRPDVPMTNPAMPVILGILPVVILVTGVLIGVHLRKR